ncbi:hypothetical protein MMC07_002739 [Pseudocyphellaria aurata]|nr:hypothetical protein [Pseudocyphellaria aurata]
MQRRHHRRIKRPTPLVFREQFKSVKNGTRNPTQARILRNLQIISKLGLEVDLHSPLLIASLKTILEYLDFCNTIKPDKLDLMLDAQESPLIFAQKLKDETLTPEQESLKVKLERIGRKDLSKCLLGENDSYVFDIDSNNSERDESADEPLAIDTETEQEPGNEE